MDKSLHVAGILIYRHQRNSTEILLVNDSFNHKRHWTAPKGRVIGDEDELKAAIRETLEITGLSVKDLKVEDGFRAELKYLSGNKPKRVVYYLAELIDHARVLPTGEGVQFSWCNVQQAVDKALYKSMQDVLRAAFSTAEKSRAKHLASLPTKHRQQQQHHHGGAASAAADHSNSDMLESSMKNLNIALPLDSQRQAISRGYNGSGLGDGRDQRYGNHRERGNGHNPHADNPNYKTRLCERFEAEGFCPYYNKCTFAHGAAELRQRPAPVEGQERSSSSSNDSRQQQQQQRQRREDASGSGGSHHERVENEFHKTRLCEKFMNDGECPFGNRCTYAHGREELRARGGGLLSTEQQREQERGFGRRREYNSNNSNYGGRTGTPTNNPGGEEADRQERWRSDREPRSGPFRSSQGEHQSQQREQQQQQQPQERYRPPPPDTSNTTGAYRAPHLRGVSTIPGSSPQATATFAATPAQEGVRLAAATTTTLSPSSAGSSIAPTTAAAAATPNPSIARVMSPAAQTLTPTSAASATAGDVTPTSGSNSPLLGGSATFDSKSSSHGSNGGRRRQQGGDHLLDKPRAKVVELSSEEMEKFQIRRPETPPVQAKPDSKQLLRDQLITDLTKFFDKQRQQEEGESSAAAKKQQYQEEVKEVTRIEMKNGLTMAQLYYILISALFTEASIETWKKVLAEKTKLIKNFCRSSEDQRTLMRAWEQFFVKRRPMMARILIILESVYDSELVEEDIILDWYNHPTTDEELKKKVTPFIEWLSSAEEE